MANPEKDNTNANERCDGQWKIPVKYVGAFITLWARVATDEQARILVMKYLTNPGSSGRRSLLRLYLNPNQVTALQNFLEMTAAAGVQTHGCL